MAIPFSTDEISKWIETADNNRTGNDTVPDVKKAEALYAQAAEAGSDTAKISMEMLKGFEDVFLPERFFEATRNLLLFRMRAERLSLEDIPYNLTLETENTEKAQRYAEKLAAVMDSLRLKRNKVIFSSEKKLLSGELRFDDPACAIIFITQCTDAIFEKIDGLTALFAKTPWVTKILCLTHEQTARLRNDHEAFFFRVIGHEFSNHISSFALRDRDILPALLFKLSQRFTLRSDFVSGISDYITCVYPKADLRGEAFVNDLFERVLRQFAHSSVQPDSIGADCVPYYKKPAADVSPVEKPAPAVEKPAPVVERSAPDTQKPDLPEYTASDLGFVNHKISLTPQRGSQKGKPKNVLLLALSTFYQTMKTSYFIYDDKLYTGIYQLDPIPKMLCDKLAKKGEYIDYVFLLDSTESDEKPIHPEVTDDEVPENDPFRHYRFIGSPLEFFKHRTRKYVSPNNPDEEKYLCFITDKIDPSDGITAAAEKIREFRDVNLYIDIHGGLRYVSIAMEAIASLLNNENVKSMEVYTVEFSKSAPKEKPTPIHKDTTHELFSFVSGINEFINFGRADSLEKYLKSRDSQLTKAIKEMADGISVCNIGKLENGVKALQEYYKTDLSEDNYLKIFRETIRDEFDSLLNENAGALEMIEWCEKKGHFQAALTMIESKMPALVFKPGYLKEPLFSEQTEQELIKLKEQMENKDSFAEWFFSSLDEYKQLSLDGTLYAGVTRNASAFMNRVSFMLFHDDKRNHYKVNVSMPNNKLALIYLEKLLKKQRNHINHVHSNNIAETEMIRDGIRAYITVVRELKKQPG